MSAQSQTKQSGSVQLFQQRFIKNFKNKKVAHALLFTDHSGFLNELIAFLSATILCTQCVPACNSCQSCTLVRAKEHPDLFQLAPEKPGGIIKIDAIRELQDKIYKTPLISKNRVIVIQPLEKLNPSSANALLKTLEEPPPNTFFLLIARTIFNVPATLLSRCQQWNIVPLTDDEHFLKQHELAHELQTLIDDLEAVIINNTPAIQIADSWLKYPFPSLISWLVLVNSQLIKLALNSIVPVNIIDKQLMRLAQKINPVKLFQQLDKLNSIIKDIHHNININNQLILEIVLLGYL